MYHLIVRAGLKHIYKMGGEEMCRYACLQSMRSKGSQGDSEECKNSSTDCPSLIHNKTPVELLYNINWPV